MSTVCVCEDSPLAREAMRRALGVVPGVERVMLAGSGEELLQRYELEQPDLVLMDVRMPGLGGVE
ncbi:MAG: response regulator, partial [Actinomycetales bacterium]